MESCGPIKVLVIADSRKFESIQKCLETQQCSVQLTGTSQWNTDFATSKRWDVLILDLEDRNHESVIATAKMCGVQSKIVLIGAKAKLYPDSHSIKNVRDSQLLIEAVAAAAGRPIITELAPSHSNGSVMPGIIGGSPPMLKMFEIIIKSALTDSSVLLTGESGTGKELVARAIHRLSSRKDQPFIDLNCAAFPGTLIESELFGYEKGAFTGAGNSKPGRFSMADKGTLFLDEVGEIPLDLQVKFIRVLQERSFTSLGGTKTFKVDFRLITATNRNLRKEIKRGGFREDLYYRLKVINIHLPPLRDRTQDIPLLIEYFAKINSDKLKRTISVSPEAHGLLLKYRWPGNVRELENAIETASAMCGSDLIGPGHLPDEIIDSADLTEILKSAILIFYDPARPLKDHSRAQECARWYNNQKKELGIDIHGAAFFRFAWDLAVPCSDDKSFFSFLLGQKYSKEVILALLEDVEINTDKGNFTRKSSRYKVLAGALSWALSKIGTSGGQPHPVAAEENALVHVPDHPFEKVKLELLGAMKRDQAFGRVLLSPPANGRIELLKDFLKEKFEGPHVVGIDCEDISLQAFWEKLCRRFVEFGVFGSGLKDSGCRDFEDFKLKIEKYHPQNVTLVVQNMDSFLKVISAILDLASITSEQRTHAQNVSNWLRHLDRLQRMDISFIGTSFISPDHVLNYLGVLDKGFLPSEPFTFLEKQLQINDDDWLEWAHKRVAGRCPELSSIPEQQFLSEIIQASCFQARVLNTGLEYHRGSGRTTVIGEMEKMHRRVAEIIIGAVPPCCSLVLQSLERIVRKDGCVKALLSAGIIKDWGGKYEPVVEYWKHVWKDERKGS